MRHYFNLILLITFSSCAIVHTSGRKGKDIYIDSTNISRINGDFSNSVIYKVSSENSSLWQRLFVKKTHHTLDWEKAIVKIEILNNHEISAQLFINDSLIDKGHLKGELKKGYFILNRQYKSKFVLGPILWTTGNVKSYLGLTKENELVLLYANVGFAMILAIPIFVAGDNNILTYTKNDH